MKVLIAFEFSGIAREAFKACGHDAMSCDLLDTEIPGKHHKGDIFKFLSGKHFDLILAHPECTYLCNSGVKHLYIDGRKENGRDEERWRLMERDAKKFRRILNTRSADRVIVENPIMHGYAQSIIGKKAAHVTQPWWFGHGEIKATCFWTRNLDDFVFVPSNIVSGREARVHKASPGPDRWKERSRSYPGMMQALAEQITELYGV